jgi:hypothetical protein
MSGKGNCNDYAAVETFFKSITLGTLLRNTLLFSATLNSSGDILGRHARRLRWLPLNTSTASTIHVTATQHWAGKAPSLSNARWLKRALGAALKRERSISKGHKDVSVTPHNCRLRLSSRRHHCPIKKSIRGTGPIFADRYGKHKTSPNYLMLYKNRKSAFSRY